MSNSEHLEHTSSYLNKMMLSLKLNGNPRISTEQQNLSDDIIVYDRDEKEHD